MKMYWLKIDVNELGRRVLLKNTLIESIIPKRLCVVLPDSGSIALRSVASRAKNLK